MFVQNEWEALFSLFSINQSFMPKMFYYKKCVFKSNRRLLFSLFLINRYCIRSVCSKRVGDYFLVYSSLISTVSLMLYYKKCVFKASGRLLFSLFTFSLVSIVHLMFYYKRCLFKASGKLRLSISIINQYCKTIALPQKIGVHREWEATF